MGKFGKALGLMAIGAAVGGLVSAAIKKVKEVEDYPLDDNFSNDKSEEVVTERFSSEDTDAFEESTEEDVVEESSEEVVIEETVTETEGGSLVDELVGEVADEFNDAIDEAMASTSAETSTSDEDSELDELFNRVEAEVNSDEDNLVDTGFNAFEELDNNDEVIDEASENDEPIDASAYNWKQEETVEDISSSEASSQVSEDDDSNDSSVFKTVCGVSRRKAIELIIDKDNGANYTVSDLNDMSDDDLADVYVKTCL